MGYSLEKNVLYGIFHKLCDVCVPWDTMIPWATVISWGSPQGLSSTVYSVKIHGTPHGICYGSPIRGLMEYSPWNIPRKETPNGHPTVHVVDTP